MIQTIINGIATVTITPVQAKYTDPAQSTELSVLIVSDNLLNTCNLQWALMYPVTVTNPDGSTTTTYVSSTSGQAIITGTDYTNWTGGNDYPFQIVAAQLGLTITS